MGDREADRPRLIDEQMAGRRSAGGFGQVDFDAIWGPIGEQFVLNFPEAHEADLFVLEWVAEMGCTFRLSKQDYRKTEWDDAYPALVIEVVSP